MGMTEETGGIEKFAKTRLAKEIRKLKAIKPASDKSTSAIMDILTSATKTQPWKSNNPFIPGSAAERLANNAGVSRFAGALRRQFDSASPEQRTLLAQIGKNSLSRHSSAKQLWKSRVSNLERAQQHIRDENRNTIPAGAVAGPNGKLVSTLTGYELPSNPLARDAVLTGEREVASVANDLGVAPVTNKHNTRDGLLPAWYWSRLETIVPLHEDTVRKLTDVGKTSSSYGSVNMNGTRIPIFDANTPKGPLAATTIKPDTNGALKAVIHAGKSSTLAGNNKNYWQATHPASVLEHELGHAFWRLGVPEQKNRVSRRFAIELQRAKRLGLPGIAEILEDPILMNEAIATYAFPTLRGSRSAIIRNANLNQQTDLASKLTEVSPAFQQALLHSRLNYNNGVDPLLALLSKYA